MEKKLPHTLVLVAIALIACAFITGYHAFYVPQPNLPKVIYAEKGTAPAGNKNPDTTLTETSPVNTPITKVNINTASADILQEKLEGVGQTIAARIVAYREENGSFQYIEEIKNIKGIGDSVFENIKNEITV